ncbi:MAG TPA: beta-ketoacyl synthase N-terminal-like domain-containing protein, partial [Methylomirabilota bacterium]|nr:beta-ketoacyl synthase N-terminal-like domain-containing protein [Methylomirabilota bacterium]
MTGDQRSSDIAIIGMSAMFAKAADMAEFWQNILDGVDAVHDADDGWALPYYEPGSTDNTRIYTRRGGFLPTRVEFEPTEFGIMPNAIHTADVDHFLALKLARDALVDAGYGEREFDRQNTGVILGRGTLLSRGYSTVAQHVQVDQTIEILKQVNPDLPADVLQKVRTKLKESLPVFNAEVAPSLVPNVITGRIANRLNLMGPNYILDGACASTLLAVELAIAELRSGRCNMVLTGGIQSATPPQVYMFFCQLNGLSRTNIRPFDGAANGTLLGEGLGILVLKRLADAERDNDRIYAVIKGLGSSSDGRALGLLAPRGEGQVLALERAYQQTGIDPGTISLIEAHGTGMPLGDKTEIETLQTIYGARGDALPVRAVGSVKSMIGHCIPAAGAASLIKTALALHDKVLPPTICDNVNPTLGVEKTSVYINNATRPWVHGEVAHPRRAVINSFGFGGVNAHAILEEYRPKEDALQRLARTKWPSELLLFAAADRNGLVARLQQVKAALSARADIRLADLACSLGRSADGDQRLAVVCTDIAEVPAKLDQAVTELAVAGKPKLSARAGFHYGEARTSAERSGTAFLFPGEGGQHQNMMGDLCLHLPPVRAWFDRLDAALAGLAPLRPSQVIFPPPTSLTADERQRLERALLSLEVASAAVFTSSMAMHELLTRLGVGCDVMVGHSTGEVSALAASGIIRHRGEQDYKDGTVRFYLAHRELVKTRRIPSGVLLTVGAVDRAQLEQLVASFGGRIHVALENCPNQTVLFGEQADVDRLAVRLKEAGAICVPLPFDRGYHTPLITEAEPILRELYDNLDVGPGRVPVFSCTSAELFPDDPAAIRDLATRQLFSRVRFRDVIEKLYAGGVRNFIEVGPGANLTGFVRDTLQRRPHLAIASNMAGKSSIAQVQQVLAQLFAQGLRIDIAPLFAHRAVQAMAFAPTAAPAARKKPPQILETLNPRMRLEPAVADEVRARIAGAANSQAVRTPSEPTRAVNESVPSAAPAAVPSSSRADPRAAGVRAHFDLMRAFLDSQARIMGQFGMAGGTAATAGAVDATDDGRWALLGRVVEESATRLVCERRFTLAGDRFLRDHTLGCMPSARYPELLPLSVMPFTVSMEILAEAATRLAGPGLRVTRMYDVRGYRWLAADRDDFTLQTTAEFVEGAAREAHVRIYEIVKGTETRRILAFEGRVVLESDFAPPPAPMPFLLASEQATHYTPDMLYGEVSSADIRYSPMFHGASFRAVTGIRRWGKEGIEGDMVALPTDGFCAGSGRPAFDTDLIGLDAASHLIAYWATERFGLDSSSFPFAVQDYRQYGPPPAPGSKVLCRVWVRVLGGGGKPAGFELLDRQGRVIERREADGPAYFPTPDSYDACRIYPSDAYIEAHFDLLDETGRVIARLTGWHDRYFEPPRQYFRCRLRPQTEFLSEPWMQAETGRVCRRIDNRSADYLERSFGIWKRALAHLSLTRQERDFWYGLPENGPRRTEWLLGRIAAKDAIRQWAQERHRVQLAPADIEILPGPLGQPLVACPALADFGPVPDVSISHSRGTIVAALSAPGSRIGIDFARFEDVRSTDLLKKAFLEQEIALLAGTAESAVLHLWCAKEAASKAHGEGLGGEPRNWVIDQYDPRAGQV